MGDFHHTLIELRNDLGYAYSDHGVCVLYAEKGADACLVGLDEFRKFSARLDFIQKSDPLLSQQIADLKESIGKRHIELEDANPLAKSTQVKLTPYEEKLFDVACFMEQGEIYLKARDYAPFFDKPYTYLDIEALSYYAESLALDQLGGRKALLSFEKMYTYVELKNYIEMFFKFANDAPGNFILSLGSDNHRICLCYNKAEQVWTALDANQTIIQKEISPAEIIDENIRLYADFIFDAYERAHTIFTGFKTNLFCTGKDAAAFAPCIKDLAASQDYKTLTEITKQNVHRIGDRNISLLWLASECGDVATIKKILSLSKSELNIACDSGETPFNMAAQNTHIDVIQLLMSLKNNKNKLLVDPNKCNQNGASTVFMAAEYGQTSVIEELAKYKNANGDFIVDFNKPYNNGAAPFYMAAQNGHLDCLNAMVKLKDKDGNFIIDPNTQNSKQLSAFLIAVDNGSTDIVQVLIHLKKPDGSYAVDLQKPSSYHSTPIIYASFNGNRKIVEMLIEAKKLGHTEIDLNQANNGGWTAVHLAAEGGHLDIIKILYENGANLFPTTNTRSPLSLAKSAKQTEVVEFYKALEKYNHLLLQISKFALTKGTQLNSKLSKDLETLTQKVMHDFKHDHQLILSTSYYDNEFLRIVSATNPKRLSFFECGKTSELSNRFVIPAQAGTHLSKPTTA